MNGQKKILILDQSGVMGGAELSLLEICRRIPRVCNVVLFDDGPFRERLTEAGVDVEVLADPGLKSLRKQGGQSLGMATVKSLLSLIGKVTSQARKRRLIYANTQKAMVIGALAGLISRRPVVWHLRDIVSPDHFDKKKLQVIRWCSKFLLTHVIANSEASAAAVKTLADLPSSKVTVVYNGIDPAPFDAIAEQPRAALRSQYGLPQEAFLVGTFSRLVEWKGQHILLEALTQLPGVHAALVGGALFGETDYEEFLHRRVRELQLEGRVHFLGFQRDVAGLMTAMDVIAHTSIAPEPFGRVIVEAMLARRPVIATASGGALEIIRDNVNGLLVAPGSVEDLADKISRLRQDDALTARLSRSAYDDASIRFNPDTYCSNVLKILEAVGKFELQRSAG